MVAALSRHIGDLASTCLDLGRQLWIRANRYWPYLCWQFGRFEVEESDGCANDYVQFEDIPMASAPDTGLAAPSIAASRSDNVLAKQCGRSLPPPVNSTSSSAKVVFRSNQRVNGDGFNVRSTVEPCILDQIGHLWRLDAAKPMI